MSDDRPPRGEAVSHDSGSDPEDGRSEVYEEALVETRNVIDVQRDMNENTDKEILRVIHVHILLLGGIATLLSYLPEVVTSALPWVVLAGCFLVFSIGVSTYIYRDTTLYAGFGDHGFDEDEKGRIVPEKKYGYDTVIDTGHRREMPDSPPEATSPPSADGFRASLLREHQAGINHNNAEIKYRIQIQQLVSLFSALGVSILGIGMVTVLSNASSVYVWGFSALLTLVAILVGVWMALKLTGLLCVYTRSEADPGRLTYGYAADIRNRDNDPNPVCALTMGMFSLDDHERE